MRLVNAWEKGCHVCPIYFGVLVAYLRISPIFSPFVGSNEWTFSVDDIIVDDDDFIDVTDVTFDASFLYPYSEEIQSVDSDSNTTLTLSINELYVELDDIIHDYMRFNIYISL